MPLLAEMEESCFGSIHNSTQCHWFIDHREEQNCPGHHAATNDLLHKKWPLHFQRRESLNYCNLMQSDMEQGEKSLSVSSRK